MSYDIVYILGQNTGSEELRYSLRSVCENFDYNKIWFYCGCPKDIKPDVYVPFKQVGYNKLDRVHSTFQAICENEEITSNFYLFNDDFFIMRPYEQEIQLCNGSLVNVAQRIEQRNKGETFYTQYLRYTSDVLNKNGYDTLSYEVHAPLLINRQKALYALQQFPENTQFRSIYGNYWHIGGKLISDTKIEDINQMPQEDVILLSTDSNSFNNGLVGDFIKERFVESCKYETIKKSSIFKSLIKKEKVEETQIQNIPEQKKFAIFKEKLYNIFRKIKKDYFTFPYEE